VQRCRVKTRSGVRVSGVENRDAARWRLSVDLNQKRQTSTVTAYSLRHNSSGSIEGWWIVIFCSPVIHRMTWQCAITLCGQCCWRHVVGHRVVSDRSLVRSCWNIWSVCSESNNTDLLLNCSLQYLERLFYFTYET